MGYNMMTCQGFSTSLMGGCSIAWLVFALLVILTMIANRQLNDAGVEFNQWSGYVGALLPYIIIISITGNLKIGLVIGLAGMFLGGILGSRLFGGGEY